LPGAALVFDTEPLPLAHRRRALGSLGQHLVGRRAPQVGARRVEHETAQLGLVAIIAPDLHLEMVGAAADLD